MKEQEISKEMRRKLDALEAKTSILSIERTELKNKLMDSETTTTYLTNTQKELEAALVEKEGHINQLKENTADSGPDQMAAIKELLQQKEAELEEIKTKLHDYKKPDTNNENTTSDTVVPEDSANPGDSIPASAAEHHSYNNSASESNQDESTGASTNNENETADNLVLDKYTNSSDSTPASTEEPHPSDSTASESNPQDGSSEEHFIKLTTNREDDGLQDKTGDENGNSDDALQGSHSEKSELPQWSSKLADNKDNSTEELDDTRQLENPQGDGSYESRGSKLLEKEVESTKEIEPMKETNPETELETSKDSLSEANQNSTQAVEPVADPAGGKPNMSIYNDETKETSKRRRRRKFRSRRKRINAAAANVDGEVTKVR
ncbi:putative leucine-rich repeat-containing protein DDB_G0290503 isoform X2 [Oryza brachyantha]|uniref:putative leucine-rich repeat-containing protein DDB_G0290503 isoform X2 n=1 Tax=Oryza brachyantha TaxID=4533 RepID=UPI001ADCA495|nr:putative leucine-rich repeat-containing protein DDB_G0290503 isoform X2 [Oryza brachyantha]